MDIEKLVQNAAYYSEQAISVPPGSLIATRVAYAQIADACAHVAYVMIEYERWQDERLRAERAEMVARRASEPPF